MKHKVTNLGTKPLTVKDASGIVWTVEPGRSFIGKIERVYHGDGPAHYTVEAVPDGD